MTTDAPLPGSAPAARPERVPAGPRRRLLRRRNIVAAFLTVALVLGAGGYWANSHPDRAAEFSRSIIGDERTAQLEGVVLRLKDEKDQLKYRLFGGRENPFGDTSTPVGGVVLSAPGVVDDAPPPPELTGPRHRGPSTEEVPASLGPPPMLLPETRILQPSPANGEGVWVIDGLPHTSVRDVLMAKTYIRPDLDRPYASVGILLLDHRRVRLHVVGGTSDPGAGPGRVPDEHRPDLLAALNGGFQKDHGRWGMYMDGVLYKTLREGYATLVVRSDGAVEIGQWGKGSFAELTADIVAARQNAVLLVEDGEVTPAARDSGTNNEVWGYVTVNSADFITWRTGIGLTKDGDLMIAAGNSLSAGTLAKAMHAAGAHVAMQLDINSPHVNVALVHQQKDSSSAAFLMETMSGNPARYLGKAERDFMYITRDESRYLP